MYLCVHIAVYINANICTRIQQVWDRELRKAVARQTLEDATAVCFSSDGAILMIGLTSGKLVPLDSRMLTPVPNATLKCGRKGISALSFSPSGKLLAAGSMDACIYLYKYQPSQSAAALGTNMLSLRSVCRGASGGVIALDWSLDSTCIMSNSDTFELILWQIPTLPAIAFGEDYEVIRAAPAPGRHCEMQWATKTCPLGWHTQTLLHPVADLKMLLTVARSNLGTVMAVGDARGKVLLYAYPCYERGKQYRTYRGHTDAVARVGFSHDDRHLASAGLSDSALIFWQVCVVCMHRCLMFDSSLVSYTHT
jgi:WD40 repeat protein